MTELTMPVGREQIRSLSVGDMISISGRIYTGRDAVLPRIAELIRQGRLAEYGIDLEGSLMFHTAVSPAGVGPTSSNKLEIEGTMEILSEAGVRIHMGKGKLKPETIAMLAEHDAVYVVVPPVTALFEDRTVSRRVVAFEELGMEALHELEVKDVRAIVAAAGGESIYD